MIFSIPFTSGVFARGNGMNNVLIPRYMCSIPTKGKNSTSKRGGEDREVAVETT
jgi:hypothetical protein